jgi:glycosyltransferase involved in cell wall biosynthesis
MRIAILTTNLQPNNGWATVAVKRGAALMELGVEVIALTVRGDAPPLGITPTDVRAVLPPVRRGNWGALKLLGSNVAIRRATAGCDLIDAVAEPYALGCILASRRVPLVVTAHGSFIPLTSQRGPARGLYRWLYRRAHIVAVSDYTAHHIGMALGIAAPDVVISGVDNLFYQTPRPPPDKRGPTILSVGAPKMRKGTLVLVEAVARVRETIPDVQCVIVGALNRAKYVDRLREKIDQLGLEQHVRLVGHLPYEEVIGLYQAADVFALAALSGPTIIEGFGLVFLEANACGLPVIGTRDSGNESAIVDGETGFLVEQANPAQLAERILAILQDRALHDRLSRGARAFAAAHDWSASAAQLLEFYERVLGANHRPE